MAWKVSKTRILPIGIDLGTAVVKMAQLRNAEGKLELVATASAEVPPDCRGDPEKRLEFLGEGICRLLKTKGFRGRKCVLSLPAAETFVQHVRLSKIPPEQVNQALRSELAGKLPFDASEAVIRHVVVGEAYNDREAGLEVIAMGASRQVVDTYLDLARRGKLQVVALNVEPCAILECFGRLFRRADDGRRVTLFLDLGEACTQVVIAHGAKLAFARNLMVGAEHIDRAAGEAMGLPAEEVRTARRSLQASDEPSPQAERIYSAVAEALGPIVPEINKCLQYYESVFPSRAVERAVFLGGQALDRRLCQRVAQRLKLPAQIGDPLARIAVAPGPAGQDELDHRQAQPSWAVAVGLSVGAQLPEAA